MHLHFHNPTYACNYPYFTPNPSLYFSQCSSPYFSLTCSQNHSLQFPLTLPIFAYNHPNSLHQKHFPQLSHLANSGCIKGPGSLGVVQPFSQFRLHQGTSELGSLVRTYTVLISPFFLVVWAVTAVLTIIDSLSLRLRKLLYYR